MLIFGAALVLAVVAIYARKRFQNKKPADVYNYKDLAGENNANASKATEKEANILEKYYDIESFKPDVLDDEDSKKVPLTQWSAWALIWLMIHALL